MSNIIDKIQVSGVTYDIGGSGGGGNPTVELTQAEYDALVTGGTVSADTYYIITDAQAGDLTNYYTKTETNTLLGGKADTATTYTKTETDNAITAATSTKQDTLVSGTNIKTINNTSLLGSGNIDIQGGGKAVSGGTNISITTGETADTINCTLPIVQKGSSYYSIAIGSNGQYINSANYCVAEGEGGGIDDSSSHSHKEGFYSKIENYCKASHVEGYYCEVKYNSKYSHAEGYYTKTTNESEHSSGRYNVSNKANNTFGDSGNTLFSVGNGTADNARHNAFEIRQNGDIYLSSGGTDIKLQDHLGGGGASYSAGTGIDITNNVISVSGVVETSAITTAITSSSTDAQVPSAKAVYDIVGDIETLLSQI